MFAPFKSLQLQEETLIAFLPKASGITYPFPSGFTQLNMTPSASVGCVVSDGCDLGVPPRTTLFNWRAQVEFGLGYGPGTFCYLYLITSNGKYPDGNLASGDNTFAFSSLNRFNNLQPLGSVVWDGNNIDTSVSSGRVSIKDRYCAVVMVSPTQGFGTGVFPNGSYFLLMPAPYEEEY